MSNPEIIIRFAKPEDAQGIIEAHYSAVHETAARDYSQETLNEWSPAVTPERVARYQRHSLPVETTVVAEIHGQIAGFGAIVESNNELRALYVAARFSRRGVGSALLRKLEELAQEKGCQELHMDGSVTAAEFYRRHGFVETARGEHTLKSGGTIECVVMRKELV